MPAQQPPRSPLTGQFFGVGTSFGAVPGAGAGLSAPSKLWSGAAVRRSVSGALGVAVALDALNAAMEMQAYATFQEAQDMVGSVALDLLGRIQARTPVDTGRARASWHVVMPGESDKYSYKDGKGRTFDGDLGVSAGPLEAWVGSNVEYMCVSSATNVLTATGYKRISRIRPGERVLTQDGTFRCVRSTTSFDAIEKPDLVQVVVEWRRGKKHHALELTVDHPVLVEDAGVLRWVPAGQLTRAMRVWAPRKVSHRAGTKVMADGTCLACGLAVRRWPRRTQIFCSIDCRADYWRRGHNPHVGRKRGPETIRRLREAVARQTHRINRLAAQTHPTSTEVAIEAWLASSGLRFDKQVLIEQAGAIVDFAVPDLRLFIEADGGYWHRDQQNDIDRDRRVLAARPGWQILHFHFADPKHRVTLNTAPIDGARYIVCNPGLKSLCNATQFETKPILSLRRYRYTPPPRHDRRGVRRKKLWDLSVEGMHSFVANGIIVSNTYLEAGSSRQAPNGMVAISVLELRGGLGASAASRSAPPPSTGRPLTWKAFVTGRMGAAMRETGSHGAAMKKLGAEWRARKR